jgi:hypothetical protein
LDEPNSLRATAVSIVRSLSRHQCGRGSGGKQSKYDIFEQLQRYGGRLADR